MNTAFINFSIFALTFVFIICSQKNSGSEEAHMTYDEYEKYKHYQKLITPQITPITFKQPSRIHQVMDAVLFTLLNSIPGMYDLIYYWATIAFISSCVDIFY